ncbi:Intracellular distribution of mitochondria [Pyricularia grisea]|uniref:Clustered mitochondria protein homolog n=1 Tax=Pyricularia grisea TaxID=148305 RepID=A0A6P8ARF7_PYRGI|nr:uncharacterized protein PgNI_09987 [Pyricularia grisea]KAI6371638.1 Intracellular distribution of mitochondria [Pyricularia grisea]TLD04714.1 hypothetical protein PgNI_09987 [Pyricularia grisea]
MAEKTNGAAAPNGAADAPKSTPEQAQDVANVPVTDENGEQIPEDTVLSLTIVLPQNSEKIPIAVSPHEQVHEVRQSIIEMPNALQYSCFHLEHKGERINDFAQISEIKDIADGDEIHLVEDPYTEKEARIHLIRVRELIGAAGDRTDSVQGILPGLSVYDTVAAEARNATTVGEYDFNAGPNVKALLPKENDPQPKTVKAIQVSPWNPPPAHFRQKGHLIYLIITTNEGEQFQITGHVGGFFVNKSSNSKFDPLPRAGPKAYAAHSLLTLIEQLSPAFSKAFTELQEYTNQREPLSTFQITNAIPAAPWLVPSANSAACTHTPDITRTQESFLVSGVENTDTLRDWNEEFQSAKELPKDGVQDRVFRERLISKLFADYNDAAARGAVLVARGEVAPLNPTEGKDAQIFVYNNVFFSFGADGVGTFTSEGGDEAARVATAKDVSGVKLVNQLDIDGLYTPGTVVVDYLGKRIVGQSIVPGIFKQREPGENQIDYGAVDGKDVVATDERFVPQFQKLSKALKVKPHAVWDKEGKRHDLEGSVETKGLVGTDGRKYVLDLYRITPLDVSWQEEVEADSDAPEYPHRMTVLRPELVELFVRQKMREWVSSEVAKRGQAKKDQPAVEEKKETKAESEEDSDSSSEEESSSDESSSEESSSDEDEEEEKKPKKKSVPKKVVKKEEVKEEKKDEKEANSDRIDVSDFSFTLNPDVFSGQVPQTEAEKEAMAADEKDVRDACEYLRKTAIPDLLNDLKESEISFPMDGQSLSRLLHKRGINLRYLGKVATAADGPRLQCLKEVSVREMIARGFKHVAATHLRYLPLPLTSSCISHLLNCLLGTAFNAKPTAEIDPSIRSLYDDADVAFENVTPESLRTAIQEEVARRFRYTLASDWYNNLPHLHMLREVCLKLGIQMQHKEFLFTSDGAASQPAAVPVTNGNGNAPTEGSKKNKKKKKAARDTSPDSVTSSSSVPHTFVPDDIINVVPIVKDSSPRSVLAEEALEAGRISILQNQRKIGQELLLESLSLHEQIYGILHPEVARVYHSLAMLYFQLEEKDAAVELARKAVIVAERTIGVDSQETLLDYLNLSLFLYQLGDSKHALEFTKHALNMWKIIYGPDHPDMITTINNAAVMLQQLKEYHESRRWFEEALRICDIVFGRQSVNSATLLFQLAQALALDQEPKAAVVKMKESYNIFLAELGPEDKNTKEAEGWLEQLTTNAVSIAKHAKDVEQRRLRAGIRFTPRAGAIGSTSTAATKAAKSEIERPAAASSMDSRSIDELLKFIEGTDKQKKPAAKKRTGRANPKRRGAEPVSTKA